MIITCLICKLNPHIDCFSRCDNCHQGFCKECYNIFRENLRHPTTENVIQNPIENVYLTSIINFQLFELNDILLCKKCSQDNDVLKGLYLIDNFGKLKYDKLNVINFI